MGRTSRLRRRKYDWKYDRKTKALLVSKPLAKITTSSIIPPAVNTSFSQLQSNLPTYVSMGWVNVTPDLEDPPVITLCKPVCHPTTIAAVKYSVRIEEGCTSGLPKASPACQVGLPGRTFSLTWQVGPWPDRPAGRLLLEIINSFCDVYSSRLFRAGH